MCSTLTCFSDRHQTTRLFKMGVDFLCSREWKWHKWQSNSEGYFFRIVYSTIFQNYMRSFENQEVKSRKYCWMIKVQSMGNQDTLRERLVSTSRAYEVSNGTRPGVRRSERPLLTYYTMLQMHYEKLVFRLMSKFGKKFIDLFNVLLVEGVIAFNIHERWTSYCLISSSYRQ